MSRNIVGDLSHLHTAGFRTHGLWFWAVCGFMAIETAGFALAAAAYLYLMQLAPQWPLADPPPALFWGTLQTILMVASLAPNAALSRASRARDRDRTRLLVVIVTACAAISLMVRGFEFTALNTQWDKDAYGSIVFAVLVLHTLHILTDFIDSAFLTAFCFTHKLDTERFTDVDDDTVYWAYVVLIWLPLYVLLYWAPRWVP